MYFKARIRNCHAILSLQILLFIYFFEREFLYLPIIYAYMKIHIFKRYLYFTYLFSEHQRLKFEIGIGFNFLTDSLSFTK